ncbi:MAG: patatin family protein [Campylobacteraceae bacterium]
MSKVALILEGGGLRGLYSAGVLDFFASKNLLFDEVVGVSMGACNGASYISNQPRRNFDIPYKMIDDARYLSYKRWFFGGDLFGMDFIFGEIPKSIDYFDFDAFTKSKTKFTAVTTDCVSGKPLYYDSFKNKEEFLQILKASCSLPFISKPVKYESKSLFDGGISDAIPLIFSKKLDVQKYIYILTQPKEYKKSPFRFGWLISLFYPKFKGLKEAMQRRDFDYNKTVEEVNILEENGEIFVIRPKKALSAKRVERDKKKLKDTYDNGFVDAQNCYENLQKYLSLESHIS